MGRETENSVATSGWAQPSVCPHGVPSGTDVGIAPILQAINNDLTGCGG